MASLPSILLTAAAPLPPALFTGTASSRGLAVFEVIGYERMVRSVFRASDALFSRSQAISQRALDEMVELARSRVPQDTGLLLSGIRGYVENGEYVFEASAVRQRPNGKQGVDYARFVEFGTKAGMRAMPTAYSTRNGFFQAGYATADRDAVNNWLVEEGRGRLAGRKFRTGRITRRVRTPHPGTAPQPFFYNSAREAFARFQARHTEAMLEELLQIEG